MLTVKCDNCGHSVEVESKFNHNNSGRSVSNGWSYLVGCGKVDEVVLDRALQAAVHFNAEADTISCII